MKTCVMKLLATLNKLNIDEAGLFPMGIANISTASIQEVVDDLMLAKMVAT